MKVCDICRCEEEVFSCQIELGARALDGSAPYQCNSDLCLCCRQRIVGAILGAVADLKTQPETVQSKAYKDGRLLAEPTVTTEVFFIPNYCASKPARGKKKH